MLKEIYMFVFGYKMQSMCFVTTAIKAAGLAWKLKSPWDP